MNCARISASADYNAAAVSWSRVSWSRARALPLLPLNEYRHDVARKRAENPSGGGMRCSSNRSVSYRAADVQPVNLDMHVQASDAEHKGALRKTRNKRRIARRRQPKEAEAGRLVPDSMANVGPTPWKRDSKQNVGYTYSSGQSRASMTQRYCYCPATMS